MTGPHPPAGSPSIPDVQQAQQHGGEDLQADAGFSRFGVRRPARRTTIRGLAVAILVAAACWYFGADAWHSILIGGVLTTVGMITSVALDDPNLSYTGWRDGSRHDRRGARRDVAELSWSLRGSFGRVGSRAVWRVQRLARQRLAPYQLDLRNPDDQSRIEELIGHRAYVVLVRGERRPPSLRSFTRCLDALDALDSRRPGEPLPMSPKRTPIFTPHRPRRARER